MSTQRPNGTVVALPFGSHRQAALTLLRAFPNLPHKTAGFLGHVCVADSLTDSQHKWLAAILEKRGFPPLSEGREE